MKNQVSVIIPAYNEEKSIGNTLQEISQVMKIHHYEYEIIVVDDGSSDNTAEAALKGGAKVIAHNFNHGYGASIKTGVNQSKYDIVLIIDADSTYPVEEIPNMISDMDIYDMVVGARIGKKVEISLPRKITKWFLTRLANYLSGAKIPDLNSGFRAMKKDAFLKFAKIIPNGFSLTTTITLAMLTNNHPVKFVPINYNRRVGKSKFKPIVDTLNFIQLIIKVSLLFNPLKIFVPLSLAMFLASVGVFMYSVFFLPYRLDITAVIIFVGGIQVFAIGMLADLIDKRMD